MSISIQSLFNSCLISVFFNGYLCNGRETGDFWSHTACSECSLYMIDVLYVETSNAAMHLRVITLLYVWSNNSLIEIIIRMRYVPNNMDQKY